MGLHLPKSDTITGIPVTALRAFLREHRYEDTEGTPGHFAWNIDVGRLNLDDKRTFHIVSTLITQGFLRPLPGQDQNYRLTHAGASLLFAKTHKRVTLAKADAAFSKLKEGIARLDAGGIRLVTEIWLFGSYMRREPLIGNIDCTILSRRLAPTHYQAFEAIAAAHGGEAWHNASMRRYGGSYVEGDYTRQIIFGGRRPAFFDAVTFDDMNLRAGMPCRRIYTAAGGWHEEALLEHHPDADGPLQRPFNALTTDQASYSARNESVRPQPIPSQKAGSATHGRELALS